MFISTLFKDPRTFAVLVLLVTFSVCVHEYLHAWVAMKMGDPTAADRGHLTLNPFKQMGLISLLMLLFIGLAWGQIPVDLRNLPTRGKRIAVALSGVGGNLLLAVIFSLLSLMVLKYLPGNIYAVWMLRNGAILNIVLLIINLLPVPGFDGFMVVREYLRIRTEKAAEAANAAFFIIVMLMFFFMDKIMNYAEYAVDLLMYLFTLIPGVFHR